VAEWIHVEAFSEYDLLGISADAVGRATASKSAVFSGSAAPSHCETAIFEGPRGCFLDVYGSTRTRPGHVTPHHAVEMAAESGAEEVCVSGLTRAFTTRHGAGGGLSQLTMNGDRKRARDEAIRGTLAGQPAHRLADLMLLRYAAQSCAPVDNLP